MTAVVPKQGSTTGEGDDEQGADLDELARLLEMERFSARRKIVEFVVAGGMLAMATSLGVFVADWLRGSDLAPEGLMDAEESDPGTPHQDGPLRPQPNQTPAGIHPTPDAPPTGASEPEDENRGSPGSPLPHEDAGTPSDGGGVARPGTAEVSPAQPPQ